MRKKGPGGFTVFSPSIRPNTFSPVGVEDTIERQGESVFWFRMQPCPCPQEQRTPDCAFCMDGQVRTFQRTRLIDQERVVEPNGCVLAPRYAPVRKVVKATWFKENPQDLTVQRINEDGTIQIAENLKHWHAVDLTYEVDLIEEETVEGQGTGDYFVKLPAAGVIVKAVEVFQQAPGQEAFERIEPIGNTFDSLVFDRRIFGRIRAKVEVFPPVKIGYRTFDVEKGRTEWGGLTAETGELELIVPNSLLFGEGDIVTFLTSELRASHSVKFHPGTDDRMMFTPIVAVENVFGFEAGLQSKRMREYREGEDFIILSAARIRWLRDKPQDGYTIMYRYHPSFRIQSHVEGSGGMDRRLPRQYRARPASTYNVRG